MGRKHSIGNGIVWNVTTEAEAQQRLARGKPDGAMAWLKDYRPHQIGKQRWTGDVGEFVRTQIARITTLDSDVVRRYARVLAYLADFCVDDGTTLDVEQVLDPDTVDRFIAAKQKKKGQTNGIPDSTAGTWRSDLRRLGPALTTKAAWEPSLKRISRPRLAPPYLQDEVVKIVRDAPRQLTPELRRAARAIVALGLGAGLDGRWNYRIRCDHIDGTGPVTVSVPDPAKRIVVVRKQFEADLLQLASNGDGPLIGSHRVSKNTSSELAARLVIARGNIRLTSSRLRSTWLLAHLDAGTPPNVLIKAAGLKTFGSTGDLIPYMRPVTAEQLARFLRDA